MHFSLLGILESLLTQKNIFVQEKYEEAIASLAEMEKRVVMAESMLEATLQYQSGQTKAQPSPRYVISLFQYLDCLCLAGVVFFSSKFNSSLSSVLFLIIFYILFDDLKWYFVSYVIFSIFKPYFYPLIIHPLHMKTPT